MLFCADLAEGQPRPLPCSRRGTLTPSSFPGARHAGRGWGGRSPPRACASPPSLETATPVSCHQTCPPAAQRQLPPLLLWALRPLLGSSFHLLSPWSRPFRAARHRRGVEGAVQPGSGRLPPGPALAAHREQTPQSAGTSSTSTAGFCAHSVGSGCPFSHLLARCAPVPAPWTRHPCPSRSPSPHSSGGRRTARPRLSNKGRLGGHQENGSVGAQPSTRLLCPGAGLASVAPH